MIAKTNDLIPPPELEVKPLSKKIMTQEEDLDVTTTTYEGGITATNDLVSNVFELSCYNEFMSFSMVVEKQLDLDLIEQIAGKLEATQYECEEKHPELSKNLSILLDILNENFDNISVRSSNQIYDPYLQLINGAELNIVSEHFSAPVIEEMPIDLNKFDLT